MSLKIIDDHAIEQWLVQATSTSQQQFESILEKARRAKGLEPSEVAHLLQVADPDQLGMLFSAAREVKRRIYGKRVVLFAPLYISNECTNNCLYCGFRRDNVQLERRTLSLEEIQDQVLCLEEMGHKRILLESGEDLSKVSIQYVVDAIKTIYATKSPQGNIRRVNVNVAATTVENYRMLKQAGIGTYQLFQETYHRPTYQVMHPTGAKSDYDYHLTAMDRALQGGIDDYGLGILYGLHDHRFEVLALLQHISYLKRHYGVGPHTISVPRLRPAPGSCLPHIDPLSDLEFKRLVAVLRLAVPYTGIILSTRESAAMRDELLDLGVSQMSAASATSPGGYKRNESSGQQFDAADHRSLAEVVGSICRKGYLPSFCTACYRVGRTGEHFMEMAEDGKIQTFCQPNALLTFAEYLQDHDSAMAAPSDLRSMLSSWVQEIADPAIRQETERRLERIGSGQRDLYF